MLNGLDFMTIIPIKKGHHRVSKLDDALTIATVTMVLVNKKW
jgi:hypothetical protein